MTTKDFLPVLEAFVAGKTIECRDSLDKEFGWSEVANANFQNWNISRYDFRIKAKPVIFYVRWCAHSYEHKTVRTHSIEKICQQCELHAFIKP